MLSRRHLLALRLINATAGTARLLAPPIGRSGPSWHFLRESQGRVGSHSCEGNGWSARLVGHRRQHRQRRPLVQVCVNSEKSEIDIYANIIILQVLT